MYRLFLPEIKYLISYVKKCCYNSFKNHNIRPWTYILSVYYEFSFCTLYGASICCYIVVNSYGPYPITCTLYIVQF
jgi:hypothetical protein